jgi:hypothetical protein
MDACIKAAWIFCGHVVLIPSSITKICDGFLLALFVCAISLMNNVQDYCSDAVLRVAGINPVSWFQQDCQTTGTVWPRMSQFRSCFEDQEGISRNSDCTSLLKKFRMSLLGG